MGIPVFVEYFQTGLVPRFPTAMLAASFMFLCGLSLATGFILDSVAKVEKKQWEVNVNSKYAGTVKILSQIDLAVLGPVLF